MNRISQYPLYRSQGDPAGRMAVCWFLSWYSVQLVEFVSWQHTLQKDSFPLHWQSTFPFSTKHNDPEHSPLTHVLAPLLQSFTVAFPDGFFSWGFGHVCEFSKQIDSLRQSSATEHLLVVELRYGLHVLGLQQNPCDGLQRFDSSLTSKAFSVYTHPILLILLVEAPIQQGSALHSGPP